MEWEQECDRAKAQKTRPGWKKLIRGPLLLAQAKPTGAAIDEGDDSNAEDEEGDENSQRGEDSP